MSERTVKREYAPVPECFRGEAPNDPWKQTLAKEQRAREAMIAVEETKILAERVKECYKKEGVNHYRNCEKFTRAYLKKISHPNYKEGPVEMSDVPDVE